MNQISEVIAEKLYRSSRAGEFIDGLVTPKVVDEWIRELKTLGVRSILCLLSHEELIVYKQLPSGYQDYCETNGFKFIHIELEDEFCSLDTIANRNLLAETYKSIELPVVVHCSSGLNRTGYVVKILRETILKDTSMK
jgi:protein-tyrosine phosphatase